MSEQNGMNIGKPKTNEVFEKKKSHQNRFIWEKKEFDQHFY